MAPKKAATDPTSRIGKPQSAYGGNKASRPGDEWFDDEQNSMDNRKTTQADSGKTYNEAGRGRKLQQKDLDTEQQVGVAGATPPSYKKGGKVHKTGLARLHKGERVIPKSKVHKVEKAMRKVSRKRG